MWQSLNKVIKYKVTKEKINDTKNINYNDVKNKYKTTDCNKQCKQEVCNDYQIQMIKYDMCKECSKKLMCYNDLEGTCEYCINFKSCDELYGCGKSEPINPLDNYCQKCW